MLIISQWRSLSQNYENQERLDSLEFGFPVGFQGPGIIQSSVSNHASMLAFPDDVDIHNNRTGTQSFVGALQSLTITGQITC